MHDLNDLIEKLEGLLAEAEPQSPRAHVTATALRFLEAGRDALATGDAQKQMAIIVKTRDQARGQQAWVLGHLRENTPEEPVMTILQHYQARLAQVEAQAMMAIAYVATERAKSEGVWWAGVAGQGVIEFATDFIGYARELPGPRRS